MSECFSYWESEAYRAGWGYEKGFSSAAAWERNITARPLFAGSEETRNRFFTGVWFRHVLPVSVLRWLLVMAAFFWFLGLAPGTMWWRIPVLLIALIVIALAVRPWRRRSRRVTTSVDDQARVRRFARRRFKAMPASALADSAVYQEAIKDLTVQEVEVVSVLAPTFMGTIGQLVTLVRCDLGLPTGV